jgi:hypothetical protein
MNPILIFLIIIICFWSIATTILAIYSILTKNFKGNKITWILIALIAIIGPLLWITKGKQLIQK